MKQKKFGFGALASAATLFVALFGAETAASAQDQSSGNAPAVVAMVVQDAVPSITFTAEPVVQPLPSPAERPVPAVTPGSVDPLRQLVGDMPVEVELSPELQCLAQAIYFEARGEPLAGQLAVATVVINRAESGLYPDNYCDVVTQPAQFSFVKRGRIPAADEGSPAWARAKALAQIAHQDLWESEARDALYFHATYVRPSWARQKVARAKIDTHIFYR